jgi:hypothetical protein
LPLHPRTRFSSPVLTASLTFRLAGSYVEAAKLAGRGLATSATLTGLQKGGGAFLFISACSGFYLVLVQMFESVDMPFKLPVGDVSKYWPKKKRVD